MGGGLVGAVWMGAEGGGDGEVVKGLEKRVREEQERRGVVEKERGDYAEKC
jgi:hypothetical protein